MYEENQWVIWVDLLWKLDSQLAREQWKILFLGINIILCKKIFLKKIQEDSSSIDNKHSITIPSRVTRIPYSSKNLKNLYYTQYTSDNYSLLKFFNNT